ncbi:LLM class flavin-dependent oxidoreductase [Rhizobium sp. SGZ-381]|uniref:LLM class flavin-dependent oxidoreductase n=1 Tax=Rhizobium sp. SGZ-381 TaxID=3342800 RepID=UPI00366BAB65
MGNYLQLGLFMPSTTGSLIIAKGTPPQSEATWELNRDVSLAAEAAGMEFLLSQVKWRGYGGESGHWDGALESFTLMAAIAAVTSRIKLIGSVAVRTMNPAVVAKMAATVSDVSAGRFVVNIVAGWNKFEYAQMGLWSDDDYYLNRYEYADEFLHILKRLWSEESVTFKGKHFQLEDCRSFPKPRQMPEIVCAGQSEGALAFVAKEADYSFIGRMNDSAEQLGQVAAKISKLAEPHGRSVHSLTLLNVIAAPTDAEAQAEKAFYLENRDEVAIKEWMRVSGMDKNRIDYLHLDPEPATFMSVPYIVGSYEKVAAHLDALAVNGITGVCLAFPDFASDVPDFIANVMPLMKSRQRAE